MKLNFKRMLSFVLALSIIIATISAVGITNLIVTAQDDKNYLKVINYEEVFADYGDNIVYANTIENIALLSWWGDWEPAPEGLTVQKLHSKYSIGSGALANNDATVAYKNNVWNGAGWESTMERSIRIMPSVTDEAANMTFGLANGGGVTKANAITSEYKNAEAVVVRISTSTHPGLVGTHSENYPGVYFELYEKQNDSTDGRNIAEHFVPKKADDLIGTTAYLIDFKTRAISSKQLGTLSEDTTEQENSGYFIPECFDGWVVLPLSYFEYTDNESLDKNGNKQIDIENLCGIKIGENHPDTNSYSYIYVEEIGLAQKTNDCVNQLANVKTSYEFDINGIESVPSSSFAAVKGTESSIDINITDSGNTVYRWQFVGADIEIVTHFNSELSIKNITESDIVDYIDTDSNAITFKQSEKSALPGKANLLLKCDSYNNGDILFLYYYSKTDNKLLPTGQTVTVTDGFVNLEIEDYGYYILSKDVCTLKKCSLSGYVKCGDFDFSPFTDLEIGAEGHLYDNKILVQGGNINVGTSNSNKAFAYGNEGVSIQMWPMYDNMESSMLFNVCNPLDNVTTNKELLKDSKALVVRMASNQAWLELPDPEFFFTLYEDNNGKTGEAFNMKSKDKLSGVYAYIIPKGGNVQKINLGKGTSFIPDAFDGWVVIPLESFEYDAAESDIKNGNKQLDKTNIGFIRMGAKKAVTALTVAYDEFGFVDDINGFFLEVTEKSENSGIASNEIKKFENNYLKAVDFEFNPLTEFEIVPEVHIYGNNVIIPNSTNGATSGTANKLLSGFTGVGTVNSNSAFAYGKLDTAIQFWPVNGDPCSGTFNLVNVNDNGGISTESFANAKALVVKLSSRAIDWMRDPQPGFFFDLYEVNPDGSLGEAFVSKNANELKGVTAYLVNQTTKAVISVPLGTDSKNKDEQKAALNFIPNGFDGWAVIPIEYFKYSESDTVVKNNGVLDMNKVGAVRIGINYPHESFTFAVDEIGFTDNVQNYLTSVYNKMSANEQPVRNENEKGYLSIVDFEFNPLNEFEIVPETHIYGNNVLIKNSAIGCGTINSNSKFAYGNDKVSIQLWPLENEKESSFNFNLRNELDNDGLNMKSLMGTKAFVIRMASRDVSWLQNPKIFFKLYELNDWGEQGEVFTAKKDLTGISAYLLDAETTEVSEVDLGSAEVFVPTKFDGWVILPLEYFEFNSSESNSSNNNKIDFEKISSIRIGAQNPVIDWTFAVDEIGVTKNVENFITLNGKPADKIIEMQQDDIKIVEKAIFEEYAGKDCNLFIRVLKGEVPQYEWSFYCPDITNPADFNPQIDVSDLTLCDFAKKWQGTEEGTCVVTKYSGALPAKGKLTINVAMRYYDETELNVYNYYESKDLLNKFEEKSKVEKGFVTINLINGGTYLLAENNISTEVHKVVIDKNENQKQSNSSLIIPIIIGGIIVILAVGVVATLIIVKKRKVIK